MITVNSLQLLLVPVVFLIMVHYYFEFIVKTENFEIHREKASLPERLTGKWQPNNLLSTAETFSIGDPSSKAVESFCEHDGYLYGADSLHRVIKYDPMNNKVQYLATAPSRVLGTRVDSKGHLFILIAESGIYEVNQSKNKLIPVYLHDPSIDPINTRNVTFLDDFDLIEREDGKHLFFISQSSQRWKLAELVDLMMENENSGRVLSFDSRNNQIDVIADKLRFPNGVQVSADKKSLLVSEFLELRVLRIPLSGSEKGKVIPLITNLPGEPDNVRISPRGTYWITLMASRSLEDGTLLDKYCLIPIVRQTLLYANRGVITAIECLSSFLNKNEWIQSWTTWTLSNAVKKLTRGAVLEVNENGDILNVLQSNDGKISLLSQALEVKSDVKEKRLLYLTSFMEQLPSRLYF